MSSQLIWTNRLFCLALGLIHNLPSQHLHRNTLITTAISDRCRWPARKTASNSKSDRLSPHECDQWFLFFSPAKRQKKTVISISILIHIYIEMNPDANERNGVYLKQVPPPAAPRHQQAAPGGISEAVKRVNQNAVRHFSRCKEGENQGETFEHNKRS